MVVPGSYNNSFKLGEDIDRIKYALGRFKEEKKLIDFFLQNEKSEYFEDELCNITSLDFEILENKIKERSLWESGGKISDKKVVRIKRDQLASCKKEIYRVIGLTESNLKQMKARHKELVEKEEEDNSLYSKLSKPVKWFKLVKEWGGFLSFCIWVIALAYFTLRTLFLG